MKAAIGSIAVALLIIVLIVSGVGVFVSAFMREYEWTMTCVLSFFGAVAIVAIAGKVMDHMESKQSAF